MSRLLVLLHTVSPLVEEFNRLAAVLPEGVELRHVLDEPLLERVRQRGHLAPEDSGHVQVHAAMAAQIGARAMLVTCSTISPCVDEVRSLVKLPVFKIDEAMASEAIRRGSRIGVLATAPITLESTQASLLAQARACGKTVEIETVAVEEAMAALMRGDGATHDNLVREAALQLAERVDVVVLAQASMARVMAVLPEGCCPAAVLSSPHSALQQLRALF